MKRMAYVITILTMAFCLPATLYAQNVPEKVAEGIGKGLAPVVTGQTVTAVEKATYEAFTKGVQAAKLRTRPAVNTSVKNVENVANIQTSLPSSTNLGKGVGVKLPKQTAVPGLNKKVAEAAKEAQRLATQDKGLMERRLVKAIKAGSEQDIIILQDLMKQNGLLTSYVKFARIQAVKAEGGKRLLPSWKTA